MLSTNRLAKSSTTRVSPSNTYVYLIDATSIRYCVSNSGSRASTRFLFHFDPTSYTRETLIHFEFLYTFRGFSGQPTRSACSLRDFFATRRLQVDNRFPPSVRLFLSLLSSQTVQRGRSTAHVTARTVITDVVPRCRARRRGFRSVVLLPRKQRSDVR